MALASVANGTQTATIGTEHTLSEQLSGGKTYVLKVDLANMVAGDIVELRVYDKVLTGGTVRVFLTRTYAHAQAEPIAASIPMAGLYYCKVTLKQVAGTGRAFDWILLSLD